MIPEDEDISYEMLVHDKRYEAIFHQLAFDEKGWTAKSDPELLSKYTEEQLEHPTAEMIYQKVKEQYPTMSFATVYKSVEIFSKLGVIQVLNTGEDSFRYDAKTSEHPHIKCTKCGRVNDVSHLDARAVESLVENETGFKVNGHQFYFYGICPDCQKK